MLLEITYFLIWSREKQISGNFNCPNSNHDNRPKTKEIAKNKTKQQQQQQKTDNDQASKVNLGIQSKYGKIRTRKKSCIKTFFAWFKRFTNNYW